MIASLRLPFEPGRLPGKHEPLPAPAELPTGAHRGQILIMFAFVMIAMLGLLGLATDVGYAMAARRAAQGAADVGALAGARVLARYPAGPASAQAEVNSIVTSNRFGAITPSLVSCEYIGNNWSVVGNCTQTVPSSAAGIRVRTRVTVNTFFMQVIPGAPNILTAAGYAKARVEAAAPDAVGDQSPFIVCGVNAWNVTSNPSTTSTAGAAYVNFTSATSPLTINASHLGKIFRIMDPSLATTARCGKTDFRGQANQANNNNKLAGSTFDYTATTTVANTVKDSIKGTEGCAVNTAVPYTCIMLLPVADASSTTGTKLKVVGFAAFKITRPISGDNTRINAQLLDDYILGSGSATADWCLTCGGMVVIRLIW